MNHATAREATAREATAREATAPQRNPLTEGRFHGSGQ